MITQIVFFSVLILFFIIILTLIVTILRLSAQSIEQNKIITKELGKIIISVTGKTTEYIGIDRYQTSEEERIEKKTVKPKKDKTPKVEKEKPEDPNQFLL